MAYGTWGSRIPCGNLFFTSLLFLGMHWRLTSRRIVNWLRSKIVPHPILVLNAKSAAAEMNHWLNAGYDRLNIGGGPKNLAGFVNLDFDLHPGVERSIHANILDLSFIPAACVGQIHLNHVIEHLTREQIILQLKEYVRILRPEGLLTVRCPNALGVLYGFWFDPVFEVDRDEFVNFGYPSDEDFGNPEDAWLHKDFYGMLHWLYGDAGSITNEHPSQLTPTYLRRLVEDAGFSVLRTTAPEAINIVLVAQKANRS